MKTSINWAHIIIYYIYIYIYIFITIILYILDYALVKSYYGPHSGCIY